MRTALFAALLTCVAAHAQLTGAFEGTVTDPSGRAVASAQMRIVEVSTNAERRLTTNEQGRYKAVQLAPGHYRLEVTARGFEPERTSTMELAAGQTLTANVALRIGVARESVTVQADTSKVDTAAGAWGGDIDQHQLD